VIVVIALAMLFKRTGSDPAPAVVPLEQQAEATTRPDPRRGAMRSPGRPLSVEAVREQRQKTAEKRKQVQQQVDRTQAEFATRYKNEPVDAAWAGAKEAELMKLGVSDQITQMGVEPQNMAVDCKSSMCRITGDFVSMSKGDDWVTLYMTNVGDKLPVASYKYVHNPDGTVSINVYALGRK
jgi:hypothetical protein